METNLPTGWMGQPSGDRSQGEDPGFLEGFCRFTWVFRDHVAVGGVLTHFKAEGSGEPEGFQTPTLSQELLGLSEGTDSPDSPGKKAFQPSGGLVLIDLSARMEKGEGNIDWLPPILVPNEDGTHNLARCLTGNQTCNPWCRGQHPTK